MTENDVKSALSESFLAMITYQCGHKCTIPSRDYGTDIKLEEMTFRGLHEGQKRFLESGLTIHGQLKATTEQQITRTSGVIKYQLENKTYNDFVFRSNGQHPLLLFLLILPDDKSEWVVCEPGFIKAQKHLYWYAIQDGASKVANEKSRKTIEIPEQNLVSLDTIDALFRNYGG